MSLFLQWAFQNFGGEAVERRSAKSATYYKTIFNSGEWNVIFEEVQSDHFHCQGRSGCLGAGQGATTVLWQGLNSGAAPPGVYLGGTSSPASSIRVSCQPVAPSLPTQLSFLAIKTWIWVVCTWIPSWNTGRQPGYLDPGAAKCSWVFHFNCTVHVEIWWCQSSISLSAGRSYGMKGKKIALLNFSLSSRNLYNGFMSAWMYLDALRWFCDFFFCKLTGLSGDWLVSSCNGIAINYRKSFAASPSTALKLFSEITLTEFLPILFVTDFALFFAFLPLQRED